MVEEDKRNKLPSNWASRKRQAEWIIQDEAARKAAQEKVDIIIKKMMNIIRSYYSIELLNFCILYTCHREKIMKE